MAEPFSTLPVKWPDIWYTAVFIRRHAADTHIEFLLRESLADDHEEPPESEVTGSVEWDGTIHWKTDCQISHCSEFDDFLEALRRVRQQGRELASQSTSPLRYPS